MSSSVSAIRKRAPRAGAKSFTSYDDFEPAFTAARRSLAAVVGPNWHLVPGASVWARLPAAWVSCKVFGRTSRAPRDQRLPAAAFWPGGRLPIGPEYVTEQLEQIREAA